MSKLITPGQFEPALDGLNQVRPLILSDEVKQSIDCPVGSMNPPNSDKIIQGTMSRCTKNGASLVNGIDGLNTQYIIPEVFGFGDTTIHTLIFPSFAMHVFVEVTQLGAVEVYWCSPAGVILSGYLATGIYDMQAHGVKFCFRKEIVGDPAAINLYGFYNN